MKRTAFLHAIRRCAIRPPAQTFPAPSFPRSLREGWETTIFFSRSAAFLVFLLASWSVWAQAPASSPAPLYRIAGTVVNSVSGEPIPRAAVALLDVESHRTVAAAVSDKDGHFSLQGLSAAKYELTASKRGFLTAFYEQHEEFNSAIVCGEGQESENLTFRLAPGATLSVTVSGDGGDPVENAKVLLFKRVYDNGLGVRMVAEGQFNSMDNGVVNMYNLPPGDYFVAVKAQPWFAMYGAKRSLSAAGQPAVRRTNAALDVVYPVTFYDGVTDENAATPIHLAAGSRERIAIVLEAVPALHIFVPLPGGSSVKGAGNEEEGPNTSSMQLSFFGIELPGVGVETADEVKDGVEEYTGIAPGHYTLQAGDPPRILTLDANADSQVAANAGTPAASFRAHIQSLAGGDLPAPIFLGLRGADPAHPVPPLRAECSQNECTLDALPPGRWELAMAGGEHNLPIVSVGEHGRTRSSNRIVAADKPLELVLTVADKCARIEGFAKKDGKGKAGVMVVLVPKDPAAHSDLFRRDQSDSDGSFALRDVAAGSYTLVAIEDGWDLEWQRPEVLAPFLPKGLAIAVPELNPTQAAAPPLRLSAPVLVQPGVEKSLPVPGTSPESSPGASSKPGGEDSLGRYGKIVAAPASN
jgi:hypothetical protein